eukprot:274241_1
MGNELSERVETITEGPYEYEYEEGTGYEISEKPWEFKKDKPLTKWKKKDVKDYMVSLTYTETTRNVMKNNVKGRDLLLARTPQALAKKLNISVEKAEGLFDLLQMQKQREMFGKNDNSDPNEHFVGSTGWQRRTMINWTPYDLKSWLVAEFGKNMSSITKLNVLKAIDDNVFNGDKMSGLEDGKKLAEILAVDTELADAIYSRFEERMAKEDVGNDEMKDDEKAPIKEKYRVRNLPWRKYKFIKLSKEPDCIMGYTNEDKIERAEMKCGHAIAADTMFYYVKSIIEKNRRAIKILCPVPNCKNKEWDWDSCLRIADMTDQEIKKYNTIKQNRTNEGKFKLCPHCNSPVVRPKTLTQYRVNCPNCTSSDWCYACSKPWKKSGKIDCGNDLCDVSNINKILQECPMVENSYLTGKGKVVPKYRACPGCLSLIEHVTACKHMDCEKKNCKTSFCFICLEVKKDGRWPKSCGESAGYNNLCEFA